METNINPFVKLKIFIINGNSELLMMGFDKLIIVFNKFEIKNYSQFVVKLNEIYEDFGVVDKITDKDGFRIVENNKIYINNIWAYFANNDIIYVSLIDKKNKISTLNLKSNINVKSRNNYEKKNYRMQEQIKNNSNENNNKNLSFSSSSSFITPSLNITSKKRKDSKVLVNEDSSSLSSSSLPNKNNHKRKIMASYSKLYKNKKIRTIDISLSSSSSSPSSSHSSSSRSRSRSFSLSPYSSSPSSSLPVNYSNSKNKKLNDTIVKKANEKNTKNKNKILPKNSFKKRNKKNNNQNRNFLGYKRKLKNNNMNNFSSFNNKKRFISEENNNKNKKIEINNQKLQYELIPSDKLDDITFLQNSYPKLFTPGINIKFRIQELLEKGIGVGDYHYGIVDNFNSENKSFLIKNLDKMNEKTMMFLYQYEDDLMFVELKNFVELWIEKDKSDSKEEEISNSNINIDIDEDLTKHFIKRQIEFYFSDNNYEKDSFLKSKEDENGYIPISVIMSFNKIKMITSDKDLFIKALKEVEKLDNSKEKENNNKLFELSEDLTKIRKIK